jgi:hypothetical protein
MTVILLAAAAQGAFFDASPPDGVSLIQQTTKPCGEEQAGYLVVPQVDAQGQCRLTVESYYPQPGDIFVYDNDSKFLKIGFRLIGSATPIHAAIVIERRDHTPAILEVGPNSQPHAFTKTYIVDVFPRLESYPGVILVRRASRRLTPEQSAALTQFAEAQEGKDFAVGRLLLQATPIRCRTGLRYMLFARTYYDRDRWICSENAVAAATIAGLLDPKRHPANAMYPRDLMIDDRYDLSESYRPAQLWVAKPNPYIDGNRVVVEHEPRPDKAGRASQPVAASSSAP